MTLLGMTNFIAMLWLGIDSARYANFRHLAACALISLCKEFNELAPSLPLLA